MNKEFKQEIRPQECEVNSNVRVQLEYKDQYGIVLNKDDSDTLSFPDVSFSQPGREIFVDGSVETSLGNFIFECKLGKAKEILTTISNFIQVSTNINDLQNKLDLARSALNSARDKYAYRGGDVDYQASRSVDDLNKIISLKKKVLENLRAELKEYML